MLNPNQIIPILVAALLPLLAPWGTALASEAEIATVDRQIREQGVRALGQLNHQAVRVDWQGRAARELAALLGHRTLVAYTTGAGSNSRN